MTKPYSLFGAFFLRVFVVLFTFTGMNNVLAFHRDISNKSGYDRNGVSADSAVRNVQVVPYNDFDGDGKTDQAVYHETSGYWYVLLSGSWSMAYQKFGETGYTPVPADYDNDGKTDLAVYHETSGYWYILMSGSGSLFYCKLGETGYTPVPGDYDGDGKADMAVYHESSGYWYIVLSSSSALFYLKFGDTGYLPERGDFDGDGKADLAVYQHTSGYWYILFSSTSQLSYQKFGETGYIPVSGDYGGDGKTDLAVFHQASGYWYVLLSRSGMLSYLKLGEMGYIPVSGDYDGDGLADIGVYYGETGYWYIYMSTEGYSQGQFGFSGAIPVNPFSKSSLGTITVEASPAEAGTVTGSGTYKVGSEVTISVETNAGYTFLQWNDGNAQSTRTVTVPASGASYTACFSRLTATITVRASPTEGGTVTGGGTYEVGSNVTISALANEGYAFTQWNDENAQSTRTVTVPASGASYTAYFSHNTVTITVEASPTEGGTVTGSGTYAIGYEATLSATANSGWAFTQWSTGSTQSTYTVTISATSTTYTAYFSEIPDVDIIGMWIGNEGCYFSNMVFYLNENVTGTNIYGDSMTGTYSMSGSVVSGTFSVEGEEYVVSFSGTLSGNTITGSWISTHDLSGDFILTKQESQSEFIRKVGFRTTHHPRWSRFVFRLR